MPDVKKEAQVAVKDAVAEAHLKVKSLLTNKYVLLGAAAIVAVLAMIVGHYL